MYYLDGAPLGSSVTGVIHHFFEKFDSDEIISRMKRSRKWRPGNPSYDKYAHMSDAEIKQHWSEVGGEAAELGTEMHANIENFYNEDPHDESPKEFGLFSEFHKTHVENLDLEAFRAEWVIYSDEHRVAGCIDMVYRNPKTGNYILADWKRSKEIKESHPFGTKGNPPLQDLDDCNWVKYSVQLNLYKWILENCYGLSVEEMWLVILHPQQDTYILKRVPDHQSLIPKVLMYWSVFKSTQ